jgi:hypothetical protein
MLHMKYLYCILPYLGVRKHSVRSFTHIVKMRESCALPSQPIVDISEVETQVCHT